MKLFFTLIGLTVLEFSIFAQEPADFVLKGTPGPSPTIRIRYDSSSNYRDGLLVIDGVPCELNEFKKMDPNDIASIDILKDGAPIAIYSCRPVRPVIIIITKASYLKKFTVKDFLNGENIPAATIRFTSGKDTVDAIADINGVLNTDKLRTGTSYEMTVSCVGYRTLKTTVIGKEQKILLEKDIKSSSEVVVIAHPRIFDGCGTILKMARSGTANTVINNKFAKPSVYPNPVKRNNSVHLDFNNDQDQVMQLSVFSLTGSLVLAQSEKIIKGLNHLSITVDAKWGGCIYNIQLRNEKGTLIRQEKLIVQ